MTGMPQRASAHQRADQVGRRFALERQQPFHAFQAVIAGRQRALYDAADPV